MTGGHKSYLNTIHLITLKTSHSFNNNLLHIITYFHFASQIGLFLLCRWMGHCANTKRHVTEKPFKRCWPLSCLLRRPLGAPPGRHCARFAAVAQWANWRGPESGWVCHVMSPTSPRVSSVDTSVHVSHQQFAHGSTHPTKDHHEYCDDTRNVDNTVVWIETWELLKLRWCLSWTMHVEWWVGWRQTHYTMHNYVRGTGVGGVASNTLHHAQLH